jgi:hypothetical protein
MRIYHLFTLAYLSLIVYKKSLFGFFVFFGIFYTTAADSQADANTQQELNQQRMNKAGARDCPACASTLAGGLN